MGSTLNKAKRNKNDEFYTRLNDIVEEVFEYKEYFKGKHVFMNADDPEESNFWRYFKGQFDFLGLSKITSTHFSDTESTYRLDYNGKETIKTPLSQNGDFRSPEAIEILKEADVVVTNPPFSLFREYISQLVEYNKDFLVIGNMNAITYKEIFPLIKDDKVWLGVNNGTMEFEIPKDAPKKTAQRTDEDGNRYQKFGNINWFTNLEHNRRKEELDIFRYFNEMHYYEYHDYDAINVDKIDDIPTDYYGKIGVPITFLNKHNPDEYRIIDRVEPCIKVSDLQENEKNPKLYKSRQVKKDGVLCQKRYHRIIIQKISEKEN